MKNENEKHQQSRGERKSDAGSLEGGEAQRVWDLTSKKHETDMQNTTYNSQHAKYSPSERQTAPHSKSHSYSLHTSPLIKRLVSSRM